MMQGQLDGCQCWGGPFSRVKFPRSHKSAGEESFQPLRWTFRLPKWAKVLHYQQWRTGHVMAMPCAGVEPHIRKTINESWDVPPLKDGRWWRNSHDEGVRDMDEWGPLQIMPPPAVHENSTTSSPSICKMPPFITALAGRHVALFPLRCRGDRARPAKAAKQGISACFKASDAGVNYYYGQKHHYCCNKQTINR